MTAGSPGPSRGNMRRALLWNYGSLVVLAASGLLVNLLIAAYYDPSILGIFNQVYAVYILASQFSVLGVHYSVLKHVAEAGPHGNPASVIGSGAALSAVLGSVCGAILYLSSTAIGRLVDSAGVAEGLAVVSAGLVFFAVNKTLFGALNGLEHMRLFAVAQAARFVLIIAFVWFAGATGLPGPYLAGALVFAEVLVCALLLGWLFATFRARALAFSREWAQRHWSFGARSFMNGVLIELNSRVDVLLLGFFLSDTAVGIYSFAALFAEGLYQLLVVLRNVVNPRLVRLIAVRDVAALALLIARTRRLVYPSMLLAVCATVAVYYVFSAYFFPGQGYAQGWTILAILGAAIWICAGFTPFDSMLMQGGFPGYQSLQSAFVVGLNVLLNLLLIPVLGIEGAAAATGLALASGALVLWYLVRRMLTFDLISLRSSAAR